MAEQERQINNNLSNNNLTYDVGDLHLVYNERLFPMVDSSVLYLKHDYYSLMQRLAAEGYILIRDFFPMFDIINARKVVLQTLYRDWNAVDCTQGKSLEEAHIANQSKGILLTGFKAVTHNPTVLNVAESTALATFFQNVIFNPKYNKTIASNSHVQHNYANEEFISASYYPENTPATFDQKWVRVHAFGENTDEHTDYYRFQGNSSNMFTAWIPLGEYEINHGTLAVCAKTHLLPGYNPESWNNNDSKQELPPEYYNIQHSAAWFSADFNPGDLVIFDIRLIHASTRNNTHKFRISIDTRWQPANCVPNTAKKAFKIFGDLNNPDTSQHDGHHSGLNNESSEQKQRER
jgi:hypothetical protein